MEPMRISGAVSGIDTENLVSQLMAIESRPLIVMRQRLAGLEVRRQTWRTLNTQIYNLQSKLTALSKVETYGRTSVTTSSAAVAGASGASAPEGSYSVTVSALARAHTVASSVLPDASTPLGYSGTIEVNGHEVTIADADTLSDVAALVNSAGAGAGASLVQTKPGEWRMVLTSATSGSAGTISLGGDASILQGLGLADESLAPNTIQAGQDAQFTINGLEITRASNLVSDVAPGLTLNLSGEGTAKITVVHDLGAVTQAVSDFVTAYNAVVDFISGQLTYDPQGGASKPALYGESSLRRLQASLRAMATDPVPGLAPGLRSLWQAGITTGPTGSVTAKQGKLVIDDARLRTVISSDLSGLKALFGAGEVNVALASAGATVTASSEVDPLAPSASSVIDGRTDPARWGLTGGGWQDGTAGVFPDWLEVALHGQRAISRIDVYTLNSQAFPADTYGIRDYLLEYWTADGWAALASADNNEAGLITHTFSPVTTDRIRLTIMASNGEGDHSRVLEISAFESNSGVARRLGELCKTFTLSGSGLADEADRTISRQVKDLNSQIQSTERRLASRKESLYRRFTAMEQTLSRMQGQSAWLAAQISSQMSLSGSRSRR